MTDEPIEIIVPPSVAGGQVYRVVGRMRRAVPERWDVPTGAWVRATKTAVMIAQMPPAGPELLARLGVADAAS